MARRIDGYVLRLRCARCERKFPHVIFSGDTDMATDGLCSLTAVEQDEVVIGEFDASERRLDYKGAENAFAERISQLLGRKDLRVIRLLRTEPSSSPHGKYPAPRTIYSCPICPSGEAQEIEKMEWERFRAVGGQITIIGDMELPVSQMAEPRWTEVDLHPDLKTFAGLLRQIESLLRADGDPWADKVGRCAVEVERRDAYGVKRFLSYLGGMGSLNDVVLMRDGAPLRNENDLLHDLIGKASELGRRLWREAEEAVEPYQPRGVTDHVDEVASPSSAPRKRTRSRFALWIFALVATILALWIAAIIAANFGIEFNLPRLH